MTYPNAEIFHSWEDSGLVCLARVVGYADALIDQDTIASIAYAVYDVDNNNTLTGSGTPAVASAIYNSAQSGSGWPYDDGYNFRCIVPAACFPTGGHRYRIQFIFTPAAGDESTFPIVYDVHCRDLLGQ